MEDQTASQLASASTAPRNPLPRRRATRFPAAAQPASPAFYQNVISIRKQLEHLKEYKNRLERIL
ncbi:hypothetical protein HN51_010987, partial [Arachis hypogaea]